MKQIYKYLLPLTDEFVLELPENYELLLVDTQQEHPYLWALVNPNITKVKVSFRIYGTGSNIDDIDKLQYIGTFFLKTKNLVWHLFKVLE